MERRGRFVQTLLVPNMTKPKGFPSEQKIAENAKKAIIKSNERTELDKILRSLPNAKNY